ncbi:hypothetical protein Tco_1051460 [Tanacetum coccineum]
MDELTRSEDERDGWSSSNNPRVAKPSFPFSFGGTGTQLSLGFNPMIVEKSLRLKDRGLSKVESVKMVIWLKQHKYNYLTKTEAWDAIKDFGIPKEQSHC